MTLALYNGDVSFNFEYGFRFDKFGISEYCSGGWGSCCSDELTYEALNA